MTTQTPPDVAALPAGATALVVARHVPHGRGLLLHARLAILLEIRDLTGVLPGIYFDAQKRPQLHVS